MLTSLKCCHGYCVNSKQTIVFNQEDQVLTKVLQNEQGSLSFPNKNWSLSFSNKLLKKITIIP